MQDAHSYPLVGRRDREGVISWRESPSSAWSRELIEMARTGNSHAAMIFDCDSRASVEIAASACVGTGPVPPPNFASARKASGHFQCGWFLRDPVHRGAGARAKPQPAAFAYAVQGNANPSSWIWNLNVYGPSGGGRTRSRPNDGIVNIAIGRTAARPWAGRAPWQAASLSSEMLSGIERQLSGEARSRSGYIMPTPDTGDRSQGPDDDGETDPLTKLREDLAAAEGRTLLAPSMAAGYGAGPGVAPTLSNEYKAHRFGINPPEAVAELRRDVERSILATFGILPSLVDPKASGTALREARRQYHAGTVVPLATLVEAALSEALNEDVTLNMRRGKATDSATLARAISSLTSSGMDLESAIVAVGL